MRNKELGEWIGTISFHLINMSLGGKILKCALIYYIKLI